MMAGGTKWCTVDRVYVSQIIDAGSAFWGTSKTEQSGELPALSKEEVRDRAFVQFNA